MSHARGKSGKYLFLYLYRALKHTRPYNHNKVDSLDSLVQIIAQPGAQIFGAPFCGKTEIHFIIPRKPVLLFKQYNTIYPKKASSDPAALGLAPLTDGKPPESQLMTPSIETFNIFIRENIT